MISLFNKIWVSVQCIRGWMVLFYLLLPNLFGHIPKKKKPVLYSDQYCNTELISERDKLTCEITALKNNCKYDRSQLL